MRRIWAVAAAFVCVATTAVAAVDFWNAKPYTEWSPKEVETILSDSPWARKISVVVPIPPRETIDAGGRGGRGDDGGGGRGFPVPAPQLKMTITWRSALPVREALARSDNGTAQPVSEQPLLDRPEHYLITLSGLPARYQRVIGSAATTSFLRRGAKAPIALFQGGIQQGAGGVLTLVFAFPRTDPIVVDDKEVEFVTTIGTIEIKQKFKLKDLVINGQLEL
jgi:hypothetical protein